jgi:Phage integrase family
MAWNELAPSGYYFVCFRIGRRKFKQSLKTKSKKKADQLTSRLEENLADVSRGRMVIPPDADLVTFLISDGRMCTPLSVPEELPLSKLFAAYFNLIPEGNLEASTIYTMKIHQKLLEKHFGAKFSVRSLTRADLQAYIVQRSKEVNSVTVKKAIVTLRTVWNWGLGEKLLEIPFPSKGLKYPKTSEKLPFNHFSEVEEMTRGMSVELAGEWWESVYLTVEDIDELLKHVEKARLPFVYPMICFAAYTGTRRSEIARARVSDVDLKNGWITLHERKKAHDKKTTRRVPITPKLGPVWNFVLWCVLWTNVYVYSIGSW